MLKRFEGQDVVGAAVKITKAGDGLSEAMQLEPEALRYGEDVWLVLHGKVSQVIYKPIRNTDALQRVHVVEAEDVVRVGADDVGELIKAEKERLTHLREDDAGVSRLPLGDDPLGVFGGSSTPTPEQAAAEAEAAQNE